MSSSIFNSNSVERRLVLFLLLCLLALEAVVRLVEPRLSRDLAHIRQLPRVAERLRSHPGHKLLILGNSLTRQAVDIDLLAAGLQNTGRPNPAVFLCVPDGTSIVNWDYALHRYFLHPGALPDEILIGTGPLHLRDVPGDASRLAAYHVDRQDLARVWRDDLVSWDQRCEFVLSRFSVLHASRHRIKPHVFGRLIPHYFDVEQWINTQRDAEQLRLGTGAPVQESHRHLDHLLSACASRGIKVRIFSVPLPAPYAESPAAIDLVTRSGGAWLSLARAPGITQNHFPDGYHLDAPGAAVFTRHLLDHLPPAP